MKRERAALAAFVAVMAACVLESAGAGPAAAAPAAVCGKVFLDANGNGVLDAGEKGIAGVAVTDGVNFVVTGPDGSYRIAIAPDPTLPHRPTQPVSVCWPTGHWPTGRWWYRLMDVKDASAVHFGLRAEAQAMPFVYLHHSDSHCRFPGGCDAFAAFVNGLGPDVRWVLDTGDTSFGEETPGGKTTFRVLAEAEKKFKPPFFHAIGNHDYVPGEDPELVGYAAWTRDMGPLRWSFDYADLHVVGIDNFDEAVKPATVDWLEKDFARQPAGKRIVLGYHYPNPDGGKFHRLLKDYRVQLVHAGHNHTQQTWTDWHAPMVTAFDYKPLGPCVVTSVTKDSIVHGYYCIGCKGVPFMHSRRCPMNWLPQVLLAGIARSRGPVHTIEGKALTGAAAPIAVSTSKVLVQARISPGAGASRVGLRAGPAEAPLEIVFTGTRLGIGGAWFPFTSQRPDKQLTLTVFYQKGMVTVWADNYFHMERPVALPAVGAVTVFAEGPAATIESLSVTEVKPDPAGGAAYTNSNMGSLRRTPD